MTKTIRFVSDHMVGVLVLWLFCCYNASLIAQSTVYPEDQPITLTGTLKFVDGYGPPGYGLMKSTKSQDMKIHYWALEMPIAITVPCKPSSPEFADIECGSTKMVRLFFPEGAEKTSGESKARTLLRHKVTVTGRLHRRTMMNEITPVFMDEANVSSAK